LLADQGECPEGISSELRDQTRAATQLLSRVVDDTYGVHSEPSFSLGGLPRDRSPQPEGWTRYINILGATPEEEHSLRDDIESSILESLAFEGMSSRFEDVSEAHEETFEWVFKDNSERFFCADFSGWLESGSGIYWVSGKAGSGKSTLMKFIWEHRGTRSRLKRWANQVPLVMINFFFWNSGSAEQKSQKGLLQSILHDIFTRCPELIPLALPLDWSKEYSHRLGGRSGTPPKISWAPRKLLKAFKETVVQIQGRIKLCLFIDGLDEYDGDHEELGQFFKAMASSSHVKFCLSSRPWVVFQDLFKEFPSLRLQDLTAGDIKRFVEAKLRSRYEFGVLAARDPRPASNLIDAIVQRADGVFLWVELVVRSLTQGLRNRDTLPDLQQRLLIFPKELEPLYEHLLDLIEPFYKSWASRAFQIMRASQNQRNCVVSPSVYSPPLTTLALYLAINDDVEVNKLVGEGGNFHHVLEKCRDTQTQVTARCAGLLEIKEDTQGRCHQYTLTGLPAQTITWLHRTARDYVENPSRWSAMVELTSDINFNPYTSMVWSCIQILTIERMEASPWLKGSRDDMVENCSFLSTSALLYAHNAERERQYSYVSVIDKLSKILSTPFKDGLDPYRQYSLEWNDYVNKYCIVHAEVTGFRAESIRPDMYGNYSRIDITSLLPLAVTYGLVTYVRAKLDAVKSNISLGVSSASLLYFVPVPELGTYHVAYPPPCREIVELLFQHGADPNANYYFSPSAWERALWWTHNIPRQDLVLQEKHSWILTEYWDLLIVMIKHGANPHLRFGFAIKDTLTIEHGLFFTPMDVFEMIYDGWEFFYECEIEIPEGVGCIIRKLRRRILLREERKRTHLGTWKKQRHNRDGISRYGGRDSYR
jgi:hypothetical protein